MNGKKSFVCFSITEQTGFEQRCVLRALTRIRFVMTNDVPELFSGTVKVDETYVGVNGKTNGRPFGIKEPNVGEGPRNNRYSGSSVATVWAEVVEDVEASTLQPLISQKVSTGSIVCSDTWKAYTGIAARGYVHRLVNHGERQVF